MTAISEYDQYDAVGLAELVRRKEVTPGGLVEEAIRRIEQVNPTLNAINMRLYDQARAAAKAGVAEGPFRGCRSCGVFSGEFIINPRFTSGWMKIAVQRKR